MIYKKYKQMTEEELKRYVEFLYVDKKFKIDKIADNLGCSIATASRICKKFNLVLDQNMSRIPYNDYGFTSIEHMLDTIKECLNLNMTKKEIAKNMNCNPKTLSRICERFNIN
jgi:AraC-like DNA-binding protein